MKYNLNSNIFPIVDVGMYSSSIDPNYMVNGDAIQDDYEEGYINYDAEEYWDNFDNNAYVNHIKETAKACFDGELEANDVKVILKLGEIYSPRFYNFATDNVDIEVKVSKIELRKYAKAHREKFDEFLKEHFTSYDGFNSWTSNNFDDWLAEFNDNREQEVGAILTFIFKDEIEELQAEFIESCFEDFCYEEFLKDDFVPFHTELRKKITEYIQNNYFKKTKDALIGTCIKKVDDDEDVAEKIAQEIIAKIEAHTISLQL